MYCINTVAIQKNTRDSERPSPGPGPVFVQVMVSLQPQKMMSRCTLIIATGIIFSVANRYAKASGIMPI